MVEFPHVFCGILPESDQLYYKATSIQFGVAFFYWVIWDQGLFKKIEVCRAYGTWFIYHNIRHGISIS